MNQAITAIRSIALENMVAESLQRAGWELIYRATSREDLGRILASHNDFVLIAAEDFLPRESRLERKIIWVTAKTEEYQLHTELRNLNQERDQRSSAIVPLATEVSVVTTLQSGVGGSTLAINLAYESAQSGSKTLLLDFNSAHPFLSRYFEILHINRTTLNTAFGFAIGEISDISHASALAGEANSFDHVVIDLGRTSTAKAIISGQRIHESLTRWSIQSAHHIYLLARGDDQSISELRDKSEELKIFAPEIPMTFLFNSQSPLTSKERRHLLERAKSCLHGEPHLMTRDVRNLSKATMRQSPLAVVAPKCALAAEIAQVHRQTLKNGR